ncbi:MAG: DUF192 domain-containing protein [Candidatus Woesebacteria bacterium]|nr:DUF192 domain-containing protein [Candidatus Woesebacteria bacterium]
MDSFKKVILPILLTIIFITVSGIFYRKNQGLSPLPINSTKTPIVRETKTVKIGDTKVTAEIAQTDTERQKGLSGRSSLDKDTGMLFVIGNNKATPTFWMKDMKIAIDIIWIKDGKIIQIDKDIEPPAVGTPDKNLKLYSPKTAVDYVLEVNSGYSDLHNIKVGDAIITE